MICKFNFHQMDPSTALMTYLESELDKIGRFLTLEGSCQIFCRMGRYERAIQIEVQTSWGRFRSIGKANDFYTAADIAAEKLSKQFKKAKDRHQSHQKHDRSKHGKLSRVNAALEYDNSPYFGMSGVKKIG